MKSIDRFYARKFNRETYNCLHFVREVWLEETGEDLTAKLDKLVETVSKRGFSKHVVRAFRLHERPVSPCIVLMQRPKSDPHVGVYIRGSVLHITEQGVEYQPVSVASRGFSIVKFYQ